MFDGIGIMPVGRPHLFTNDFAVFDQRGVQSIRHRTGVVASICFLPGIVCFSFLLRHTFVEVAGRGGYEVFPIGLVDTLGQHVRMEDDGYEFSAKGINGFPRTQGQPRRLHLVQHLPKIVFRECRHKLLAPIVMVNAIGEPHTLQILFQSTKLIRIVVYGVVCIDGFQHLADAEVIFSILVEGDVPTIKGSFGEIIHQNLLTQR